MQMRVLMYYESLRKIAGLIVPSPSTSLPAWRFHSLFHWKHITLLSLNSAQKTRIYAFNDGFGRWLRYLLFFK